MQRADATSRLTRADSELECGARLDSARRLGDGVLKLVEARNLRLDGFEVEIWIPLDLRYLATLDD